MTRASGFSWSGFAIDFVTIGFFLLPVIILTFYVGGFSPEILLHEEFLSVIASNFLQAVLSAVAIVALSVIGAMGLLSAQGYRHREALRVAAYFPCFVPVIIVGLASLKFFPWARGLFGVVFVHALINVGLGSIIIADLIFQNCRGQAELAVIEGASRFWFFRRGVWPEIRSHIGILTLYFFAIAFTSFSVPLLIGGSRASTLEVLIWQKIRIDGRWDEALTLACVQIVAVLVLTVFLKGRAQANLNDSKREMPLLHLRVGSLVFLLPCVAVVLGLLTGTRKGLHMLLIDANLRNDFPRLMLGSITVGVGSGILVALVLLTLAYRPPSRLVNRFLLGFVSPSSALTGFALLIFWQASGFASLLKIILGLTLIAVPAFYRLRWASVLSQLTGEREIAATLGANADQTFWHVIFPQVIEQAMNLAALASLWAWGDFALSSVIGERSLTLAMSAQAMMESYRLEAATVIIWILLLGGASNFAAFKGVGRVLGAQSLS